MEYYDGEYQYLGDILGRDCIIVKFYDGWLRIYANEGKKIKSGIISNTG